MIALAPREHPRDSVSHEQSKCAGRSSDACKVLPHVPHRIELLAGFCDFFLQLGGCLVEAIALFDSALFEIGMPAFAVLLELADDAAAEADGDGMRARARLELREEVPDVGLDRLLREEQALADLPVHEAVCDEQDILDVTGPPPGGRTGFEAAIRAANRRRRLT